MGLYYNQTGFTLIEIIITLVISGMLGAVLYSYFGKTFTSSSNPVVRLNKAFNHQQVMENITADYLKNYTTNLVTLKTNIGAEATNQNNSYGQYYVINNRYIKFAGQTEATDDTGANNLLKVTIRNDLGEILTVLFAKQ
ncbi:MAG: prepilin-type N-terminal cleavage/methylation domain-containing protein [Nitrospirae bacterium]|nr:prepilin-type N-terminal cleavage/methylation domain-containing protein [Nitrospirota bacterium]